MIPNEFEVRPITYADIKEWCLFKHYAHRIPSISYAFGLYRERVLEGVCTFGEPATPHLVTGAFGGKYIDTFLELNRLCVNGGLPKNTLSYFVSQSLNMLPKPMVVVSYADSGQNHHGYIYQATNWIYTGMSAAHKGHHLEGRENLHQRHINEIGGGHKTIAELKALYGDKLTEYWIAPKYRYFYFLGDKRQVREMRRNLKYKVVKEYPKGDNERYDASYKPSYQGLLF